MKLTKVAGAENPSDLVTKHLSAAVAKGHLERLCMRTSGGRAATAPTVATVSLAQLADNTDLEENPCMPVRPLHVDQWLETSTHCVRVHRAGRSCFFTPPRVAGIPPSKALVAVRIIEGCYIDNGEKYKRVDNWKGRTAHQSMPRRWTGTTTFMRVSL